MKISRQSIYGMQKLVKDWQYFGDTLRIGPKDGDLAFQKFNGTDWIDYIFGGSLVHFQFSLDAIVWEEEWIDGANYLRISSDNGETWTGPIGFSDSPESVRYTNLESTPQSIGGIPAGSSFENKTMQQMWDDLLYPELFPTLTNPSGTFNLTPSGLIEIGSITNLSFTANFNRGTINPAYGTSGFRSGLPNTYTYTGSGLPASVASISLSNTQSINDYEITIGAHTWTNRVSFDGGEQPLSNKGNNFDSPLAPGQTSVRTVSIIGVYPYYATTVNISTLTKQPLASMSSTYIQTNMVAEIDDINKQTIQVPNEWLTITGIQFYNTFSSTWEWINGSKLASLSTFTSSSITVGSIPYTQLRHSGPQIGARQLRFYTN